MITKCKLEHIFFILPNLKVEHPNSKPPCILFTVKTICCIETNDNHLQFLQFLSIFLLIKCTFTSLNVIYLNV